MDNWQMDGPPHHNHVEEEGGGGGGIKMTIQKLNYTDYIEKWP